MNRLMILAAVVMSVAMSPISALAENAPANENTTQRFERLRKAAIVTVQNAMHDDVQKLMDGGSAFIQEIKRLNNILKDMTEKPEEAGWFSSVTPSMFGITNKPQGRAIIDEQLVGVADILSGTYISFVKLQIDALTTKITTAKKALDDDEWKFQSDTSIPETRQGWDMTTMTKADYERRIETSKASLKVLVDERRDKQILMLAALREAGVKLKNQAQYDALMNSLNGQDDIRIMAAASTIKNYMIVKGERLRAQPLNVEYAKEYYSERALLTRTLMIMHERYIERVSDVYKPKLKEVMKNSAKRQAELEKRAGENNTNLTPAEIQLSKRTISLLANQTKVAESYIKFLDVNVERMQKSLEKLKAKYSVSENAYFAIEQADRIQNEILSADFLGEAMNFEMPDLVVADFSNLEGAMQDLNSEIQKRN